MLTINSSIASLVEKGFSEDDDESQFNENQKKDAKALYLIQQALDERILIRITEAQTSEQAWELLRTEYQGSSKILIVKLHTLRQEFEIMRMKNGESVQDFISRILDVVYQVRTLGDTLIEQAVVS